MKNLMVRFLDDESGATAIEYGLIATGIALVIFAGAGELGAALNTMFSEIAAALGTI